MSNDYFQFKDFSIYQNISNVKITTDSILIGYWICQDKHYSYLDIGTGTGIIALLIASKNIQARIDAIEINSDNYQQALLNFQNSKFADRLIAINNSLQNYTTHKKYDAIVSNPPFYNATYLSLDKDRNTARQTIDLSFEELFHCASIMLNNTGKLYVIIPYDQRIKLTNIAFKNKLFLYKALEVIDNQNPIRILMTFSKDENYKGVEQLIIREHSVYTKQYQEILNVFFYKQY